MAQLGLGTIGESVRTGGIIAMLLVVMRFYLANRKLKMEARKDDRQGYGDIIDRLKGQVTDIYAKLEQCERERETDREALTAAIRRIGELEGYMLGQGKAQQEAAGIVAIERLERRDGAK